MPFTVKYDENAGGVVIMALIQSREEQNDFERDYLAAMEAMSRNNAPKPKRSKGNWRDLFINIIRHAQHYAPENNAMNLGDPYGFKDAAIRMWRAISDASYVDARQYVEKLIKGDAPYPEGTEHDNLSDDAMAEAGRLFNEAETKAG